jgi:hypothetical protein
MTAQPIKGTSCCPALLVVVMQRCGRGGILPACGMKRRKLLITCFFPPPPHKTNFHHRCLSLPSTPSPLPLPPRTTIGMTVTAARGRVGIMRRRRTRRRRWPQVPSGNAPPRKAAAAGLPPLSIVRRTGTCTRFSWTRVSERAGGRVGGWVEWLGGEGGWVDVPTHSFLRLTHTHPLFIHPSHPHSVQCGPPPQFPFHAWPHRLV